MQNYLQNSSTETIRYRANSLHRHYSPVTCDRAVTRVSARIGLAVGRRYVAGLHFIADDVDVDLCVEIKAAFGRSRVIIVAGDPRDEDLGELALVLFRFLSPKWQLTGEHRYSSNDSNISEFAYQRHRVTLALKRIF